MTGQYAICANATGRSSPAPASPALAGAAPAASMNVLIIQHSATAPPAATGILSSAQVLCSLRPSGERRREARSVATAATNSSIASPSDATAAVSASASAVTFAAEGGPAPGGAGGRGRI